MNPPSHTPVITNLPARIYLCFGDDVSPESPLDFARLNDPNYPSGADITWCQDRIDDTDPAYVREDIVSPLLSALEAQEEADAAHEARLELYRKIIATEGLTPSKASMTEQDRLLQVASDAKAHAKVLRTTALAAAKAQG